MSLLWSCRTYIIHYTLPALLLNCKTNAKKNYFPNPILSTKIGSRKCSSDSKKVSGDFR